MVIYGIFGDAIVYYFLEPKDLFVLIFTLFARLGFVGYIHGLSISHELKTYPMGWLLGEKKNLKCTNVDIQLDKEDNILKNGKSS